MPKRSPVDKAVAAIEAEIKVLQTVLEKLKEQLPAKAPVRRPRAVPSKDKETA